jgi:methylthioribose-1-phosphate isomerase
MKLCSRASAPAIGIAAAYGVVLVFNDAQRPGASTVLQAIDCLAATRPTAVNLFWALERMRQTALAHADDPPDRLADRLLQEAKRIHDEDLEAGQKLGLNGLTLLADGMRVMTHCHAGGVATSGYGTALAPLLVSRDQGIALQAMVNETRPLLQGSRITAWELNKAGIPATLITDSMAGHAMQQGMVDAVIVGADRIAANGDVANKIGTYALAVLAKAHGLPFYVSAPLSTIDRGIPDGKAIVIEERAPDEITRGFGRQTAPDAISVYNPAFDVTPAILVTALITERGVITDPDEAKIAALFD